MRDTARTLPGIERNAVGCLGSTRSAFAWYIFHGTINLERLRRDGPGPLEAGRRPYSTTFCRLPPVRAKLRLAAGLTQQEVAEVVGVKRVAVARWEPGPDVPPAPSPCGLPTSAQPARGAVSRGREAR
ncbi:helix-turn-helix transcriptional regulator [Streptomyces hydrogenans]|uniref:helix-turn-helix transcriptional regulator n=1 Tax=Streptomyces hydrogenans TaxID=1873719 RepID=UPI001CFCF4ED|nr:helix-turn-helix transcriptional regulator [Streptomyces hydrogenans]